MRNHKDNFLAAWWETKYLSKIANFFLRTWENVRVKHNLSLNIQFNVISINSTIKIQPKRFLKFQGSKNVFLSNWTTDCLGISKFRIFDVFSYSSWIFTLLVLGRLICLSSSFKIENTPLSFKKKYNKDAPDGKLCTYLWNQEVMKGKTTYVRLISSSTVTIRLNLI